MLFLTRRRLLTTTLAAMALIGPARAVFAQGPAAFDPAAFQTLKTVIKTAAGDRSVTYRFWRAVPYLGMPVDAAHQSLNLSVPVEIDGQPVDASRAPILLHNNVGGYMPSNMSEATGIDEVAFTPPPGMGQQQGAEAPSGSAAMLARGERVSNAKLALAAGFVVCEPGARGRTLQDAGGVWYGTAPAAIVDLKAAVRFLRANKAVIPGDVERIVSSGTSAGGALSALLGATGDDPRYEPYLDALGAATESDAILAAGCWCPITDLDHADAAYEWMWGNNPPGDGAAVDAALSQTLAEAFPPYQASLGLTDSTGAPLTAERLKEVLLQHHLIPEATAFLVGLAEADRVAYLAANPGIGWDGTTARFDWAAYLAHVGARKKGAPAFDRPDLSSGENNLFGGGTVEARNFTDTGLQLATGDAGAEIDNDLREVVALMNPMPSLAAANPGRARNWWLRVGAKDTDTALTVVANLSAAVEALGDSVSTRMYWDAGHGANEDADAFLDWISAITAYPRM
jgi:acetyl esterase/lipase